MTMSDEATRMVMIAAGELVKHTDDAVVEEAARLAVSLVGWSDAGGDSLLDELNAAFEVDERLAQTDGRAELAEALAELELKAGEDYLHGAKRMAVARLLMIGVSKRVFALATDYERITGYKNVSGWASDYATTETRRALYVRGSDDEPLMAALEQRWRPLTLVEQHDDGMTVYDWRWDETWRYTGTATIDELNAGLYVNGNCYGEMIASLVEEYGVTCWVQVK
jgi:hypothetical protein